jgi:hypothetical protein
MYFRTFALLITLFSALLCSCSTPGVRAVPVEIEKSRIYDAPFEVVWPAIIGGVAESNLKITALEKDSGLIAISDATYSPLDANEGARGTVMGVPDLVVIRVAALNIFATRPSENQTRVQVNTSMKMQIRSGNGSQMIPFQYRWEESYSNGRIERLVLDGIANRLAKQ